MVATARPATACGHGASSSSSSGGGSSGGHGSGVASVIGGILGAIAGSGGSRSRDTRPSTSVSHTIPEASSEGASGDPSPMHVSYTEEPSEPAHPSVPPPPPGTPPRDPMTPSIEGSLGFAWATQQQGTLAWTGWQGHPILGEQVDSASEVPGRRLGMNRVTMLGATVRANVLLFDMLTLGPSMSFLQQVDENSYVRPGSMSFATDRIHTMEYGGQAGLLVRIGPATLRGELFVGRQHSWATVLGLGTAGCDAPPVITEDHWVLTPRAMITGAVSRNVTIGAYAGVDTLHFGDWSGGVMLSLHGGGFATPAPEMPVP